MAQVVTKSDFQKEVLDYSGVTLIDFFAPWCGPCQMLLPTIDKLSENLPAGSKVVKINIDNDPEIASQFEVMSIPTLVVIKNGKPVDAFVGVLKENELKEMIENHL